MSRPGTTVPARQKKPPKKQTIHSLYGSAICKGSLDFTFHESNLFMQLFSGTGDIQIL